MLGNVTILVIACLVLLELLVFAGKEIRRLTTPKPS